MAVQTQTGFLNNLDIYIEFCEPNETAWMEATRGVHDMRSEVNALISGKIQVLRSDLRKLRNYATTL
jgi:hypothetical protein